MTTTAPAITADEITADNEKDFLITFEKEECFRCCGTGYYGPMVIDGGRCFDCRGKKVRLTKAGRKAYETTSKLRDELMGTPVTELAADDVVFVDNRWRKLVAVREDESYSKVTIGDQVTEYFTRVTLKYGTHGQAGISMYPTNKVWRYSPEAKAELLRRLLTVNGAIITRKEQAA